MSIERLRREVMAALDAEEARQREGAPTPQRVPASTRQDALMHFMVELCRLGVTGEEVTMLVSRDEMLEWVNEAEAQRNYQYNTGYVVVRLFGPGSNVVEIKVKP